MAHLEKTISLHVDDVQYLTEPSEGMKLARRIITELRSRGVDVLSPQSDPHHLCSVLLGMAADYVKLVDAKQSAGE
jgi:hypothetical protein